MQCHWPTQIIKVLSLSIMFPLIRVQLVLLLQGGLALARAFVILFPVSSRFGSLLLSSMVDLFALP
ncbi:hypothetical protein BDW74DRAFT_161551 [Aspergillus multicolor]|uniref:uncharacterized protein n=1 Tax=Aspergillus multicolor TaxID=41759 RepID=UPI003CCD2C68